MNPVARSTINALYTEPDRRAIMAACRVTPSVVNELLTWLKSKDYSKVTAYPEQVRVSVTFDVTVQHWIDGNFFSDFRSQIRVSRLAPVFNIEHSFSVQNQYPKSLAPWLRGFGSAYIPPQHELHEQVKATLEGAGYTELDLWDMDYPVEMFLGTPLHTENFLPTVRQALFEDLLDVLEDENGDSRTSDS
ncbi:MAG: hypothetical protein Tsb0020_03800 [Haliangiales bacterium]